VYTYIKQYTIKGGDMFKIGEFSKLSSISIRMLRYYDEKDILKPEFVDPSSGFRYYFAKQLTTVGKIQKLKSLGFSLAVIRNMLAANNLETYFEIREEELKEELQVIQSQGRMLESLKNQLDRQDSLMPYNVILKTIPRRRVISLRRQVNSYYAEGQLWEALEEFSSKHNILFDTDGYAMAIYHDPVYREDNADIEIQCSITDACKTVEDEEFKFFTTMSIQVASVTFSGSYEQMPLVTKASAQWIEDNHYKISGPMFNIFHVSPATESNPDKYITEACIEVKKDVV
jgi:DNA-binding transcriptional MerR regulator